MHVRNPAPAAPARSTSKAAARPQQLRDAAPARTSLAERLSPPSGEKSSAELRTMASVFVKRNSGGSYWDDNRSKRYPDPKDGNNGVFAYQVSGKAAETLTEIANAYLKDSRQTLKLAKHESLVVVRNSEDEPGMYFAVQDRRTGKVRPVEGEMKIDELGDKLPAKRFEKLAPTGDSFDAIEALLKSGAALSIGNR